MRRDMAPDCVPSRGSSERQREERLAVGAPRLELEVRRGEELHDRRSIVLATDLGADRLAIAEADDAEGGDRDALVAGRHEVHLDPVQRTVVERTMLEPRRIEV